MLRRLRFLAIIALGVSLVLTLSSPEHGASAAAGGVISGRVMWDLDHDGDASDVSEPGLAGWTLVLESDSAEDPINEEAKTDNDGLYAFQGLPYGNYDISMPCDGQPNAWGYSITEFAGYSVNLEPGGERDDFNFPVIPIVSAPPRTGKITGKVVLDEDRDGRVSDSDQGMTGWHVTAGRAEAVGTCAEEQQPFETDVDAEGRFTLEHLAAGTYSVYPTSDSAPLKRWAVDSPLAAPQGGAANFFSMPTIEVSEDGTGKITVGVLSLEGTASISGSIYADLDRNGTRDTGEPTAMTGCWMSLTYHFRDSYIAVNPLFSNCEPDGIYRFTGLAPGDYVVGALYQFSLAVSPPPGPDIVPHLAVSLTEGEQRTGVDFGFEAVPGSKELATQPLVTPGPTAPVVNGLPPLGAGTENSRGSTLAVAVALAAAGVMGLALGARWWARRCG